MVCVCKDSTGRRLWTFISLCVISLLPDKTLENKHPRKTKDSASGL